MQTGQDMREVAMCFFNVFHDLAASFPSLGGILTTPSLGGHTKVLMSFIRRTDIKTGGHIWDRDVFQIFQTLDPS